MQTVTNMDANGVTGTLGPREALLTGNVNYMIPWVCTARPAYGSDNLGGQPIEEAIRTSTTCYMRGLKETVSIRTTNGDPWKWRRICFRMKGDDITAFATALSRTDYLDTSPAQRGIMRPVTNWFAETGLPTRITSILFAGDEGKDWADFMLAQVDTNRVSVEYDKTKHLQAGNESGFIRTMKRWHPMNKNLVYNDDQSGSEAAVRPYSTTGLKGMGDYYVVDFFKSNGSPEAQVGLRYNSTLYWHEK